MSYIPDCKVIISTPSYCNDFNTNLKQHSNKNETNANVFLSIFDRTELIIGVSEAKTVKEVDFEVRLPPAPPKLAKNNENVTKLIENADRSRSNG